MKKTYIKPTVGITPAITDASLLLGSQLDHADAKPFKKREKLYKSSLPKKAWEDEEEEWEDDWLVLPKNYNPWKD